MKIIINENKKMYWHRFKCKKCKTEFVVNTRHAIILNECYTNCPKCYSICIKIASFASRSLSKYIKRLGTHGALICLIWIFY